MKLTGCHGWRGKTVRMGGWRDDGLEGYKWRVDVVKGWEGKCVVTFASLEFLCACIPDEQ